MVFLEFRLKFTKFWGNLWISSHTQRAFLTGFPMPSMGGVWIFYGIAQQSALSSFNGNVSQVFCKCDNSLQTKSENSVVAL